MSIGDKILLSVFIFWCSLLVLSQPLLFIYETLKEWILNGPRKRAIIRFLEAHPKTWRSANTIMVELDRLGLSIDIERDFFKFMRPLVAKHDLNVRLLCRVYEDWQSPGNICFRAGKKAKNAPPERVFLVPRSS